MARQQITFKEGSFTEYTSVKTGKVSVFKYMWTIKPFAAEEDFLMLGVDITPIVNENYYSGANMLLGEFPDLENSLVKLKVKYDGTFAIQSTFTTLYVCVTSTDMLFDVINNFSSVLRTLGICPEPVIGWSCAFPSIEYGNDMINHVLHTGGFSIYDMERHMIKCAKLEGVKHYDDEALEEGLPIESDVKFNPKESRDIAAFINEVMKSTKKSISKDYKELDKEFLDSAPPVDENKLIMMNMWV